MRCSYNRPTNISWAITGTGSAFIGDPADLTNGQPASPCRIQWTSNSPTITDTVTLTGTLGTTLKCGLAGLLLPQTTTAATLPAGVKVTVSGKLSGSGVALGGNALTQRTVLLPNGATALWWVFPAVNIDTIIVTIYNDQNSATWATASELVDLGEIWCGAAADFAIKEDMEQDFDGGLLQRQSHNNQNWPLLIEGYRSLTINLVPMVEAVAIGPNSAQDDFQTVLTALSTQATTVLVPYYLYREGGTATGQPPAAINTTTISEQRLQRSAILGAPDQPIKLNGIGDDAFYISPIVFGESPP